MIAGTTASGHLGSGQVKQAFDPATGAFAAFNALLKEFYLPGVIDILNSKRILSRYLRRNTRDVQGKTIHTALNTGRNVGTQYITEGSQLPDPGRQTYRQATYTTKYHYGRILFTGQAASSSRGNRGAFLRLMDGEVQGLARDMQNEDNRVMFGTGSGRMAEVSAAISSPGTGTIVPVSNPGGITAQGSGAQYFEVGQRLCFMIFANEATTAVGAADDANFQATAGGISSDVIESIDAASSTITMSLDWTGGNLAAGDFIYRASRDQLSPILDSDTNRGHEMNGLAAIISETDPPLQRPDGDGTDPDESAGLGNLTPTDSTPIFGAFEPRWAAFAVQNGGTPVPFQESMFQQAMDGLDLAGDGAVQLWMTTHGVRRAYAFTLTQQKRFVNTLELPGGFKALTYNDIPVVVDKDCSRGRIYGMDLDAIELAYENDYNWLDKDGSVLHRLNDFDAYQATLFRYSELICRARNRLTVIRDIQDS